MQNRLQFYIDGKWVDALDGGPGVRTRRYAGENASDEDNNAKLLAALRGLPPGLTLNPSTGAISGTPTTPTTPAP